MHKIKIHEWKDWFLEYIGDNKYELVQKKDHAVVAIVAKNAMDAERQCHKIIEKVKSS